VTVAVLGLLALLYFYLKRKKNDGDWKRDSTFDMMAPSSYPDPYSHQLGGGHNAPSRGWEEDFDDDVMSETGGGRSNKSRRSRDGRSNNHDEAYY